MRSENLSAHQRFLMAFAALTTLLIGSMIECPSLSVDTATRATIALASWLLAALCVSVLMEDLVGARLRGLLRAALARMRIAY